MTGAAGPVRARLLVSGQVQGVFYRQATADEARRLGLRGFARNLPDGRVEVEAEGERAEIEALVRFCRRGPPAARVDDVSVDWMPPTGEPDPFTVRR